MSEAQVRLYSTTCAGTLKVRSDILRIKNLLDAKRVQYDEVRRAPITSHFNFFAGVAGLGRFTRPRSSPGAAGGARMTRRCRCRPAPSYRRRCARPLTPPPACHPFTARRWTWLLSPSGARPCWLAATA
jgi:hypothetical protein